MSRKPRTRPVLDEVTDRDSVTRTATPETPPTLDAAVKRIFAYGPSRKRQASKSRTSQ